MSTRQQIIANALRQRYEEVCKTSSQLVEGREFKPWVAPKVWLEPVSDSLTTIRALAADQEVKCVETTRPEDARFFEELLAASREPQRRFDLLTTRYLHPLNVAASSEHTVREHLLERLMVADRSRIEQNSLHLLNADDLLLKLNLIAIYASFTSDLRYLDALNYFYELLPVTWQPDSPHNWLRVSFLTFYVRALAVHLK